VGTHWEQKENEKSSNTPHPKRKVEALGVHDAPFH